MAPPPPPERRTDVRLKLKVPVEIHVDDNSSPFRGATSDLSLHGCYIESIFPFSVGTKVELKLQTTGTLLILGHVATADPQVGNGIHFDKILPEDLEELRVFLAAAEKKAADSAETA